VVLDLNEVVDEISEFSERWTKVPRGQLDDDICLVRWEIMGQMSTAGQLRGCTPRPLRPPTMAVFHNRRNPVNQGGYKVQDREAHFPVWRHTSRVRYRPRPRITKA